MDFYNIPNQYRPIPFWSWNEQLDQEETLRQITLMHEAGIGGYFMHARGGLQTPYMGSQWHENIAAGIEAGQKFQMGAWAYDENGWPSGFGNGKINGRGPAYQQKYLRWEPGEGHTNTTIANVGGYHFYYEINPFYVDLLDKSVVKAFLEEIYTPYYERYGNTLTGFFTDEPQLSRNGMPWSLCLEDAYREAYGEELTPLLPQLVFDVGDFTATRVRFWKLVAQMFVESFAKQVYTWCEEHGLKLTGHMVLEETLQSQLCSNGAIMPNYEYFHIPGMDCLGRCKIDKTIVLQLNSVAQQLGKKQVLSETFALTGWNVTFEELKMMYEWQMVRGVNLLCTHLSAYSLRGIRKRDYPAAFSYQQPWWPEYKTFIDTVSRIGMLLAEGRPICDVLLLHPQPTAWTYRFDDNAAMDALQRRFDRAIDMLEEKHRLFHLGDELLLEKYGRVENGRLILGTQAYTTVAMLPDTLLLPHTRQLLDEFVRQGGILLSPEEVPADHTVDNPNVTLTVRTFEDFRFYYLVNSTEEPQPITMTVGDTLLNALTGETSPFTGNALLQPNESLLVLDHGRGFAPGKAEKPIGKKFPLDGLWKIDRCDFNAITLDRCTYWFDGELIEENGPVISIQDRACALERPVDIAMEYHLQVAQVPETAYLVCETPEIFTFTVNGKPFAPTDCGFYQDKTFRMLNLAGCLQPGDNCIRLECRFAQSNSVYETLRAGRKFETYKNKLTYDMEIESLYVVGDFSVKTDGSFELLERQAVRYHGTFALDRPFKEVSLMDLQQQGFPFFAGQLTLRKQFIAAPCEKCYLELNQKLVHVVSVSVNGQTVGKILWKPYRLDLTPYLQAGENEIQLTLTNSMRNLLGPHHLQIGESYWVVPGSFFRDSGIWGTVKDGTWNEDYCFVRFGIE